MVDYVEILGAGPCAGVDHLAILHDGEGVNCQGEPVIIEAQKADDSIDTGYGGTVTLSTSTGNGDWLLVSGNGTYTFSGLSVNTGSPSTVR